MVLIISLANRGRNLAMSKLKIGNKKLICISTIVYTCYQGLKSLLEERSISFFINSISAKKSSIVNII
jgi:hypothetical protein